MNQLFQDSHPQIDLHSLAGTRGDGVVDEDDKYHL